MSNIESIIVDGVRYDKVKAKTEFVCEECELREECGCHPSFGLAAKCYASARAADCWKREG